MSASSSSTRWSTVRRSRATGAGQLIDVVATERGIAVNPARQDLLDASKGSDLPLRPIEEIKAEVERFCGGKPRKARVTDNPVAVIKWVDGTLIDAVFQVEP
ncbi:MAG: citrate lyase subunit alpha, partial [Thermoanaerobaculia bacterium]